MPRLTSRFLFSTAALLTVLACALFPSQAPGTSLSLQAREEIRTVLASSYPPRLVLGRPIYLDDKLLPDFYGDRGFLPAWIGDLGLSPAGWELIEALRSAGVEGLCPEDYHLRYLEPLIGLERDYRPYGILFDPGYMARLDLLLTDAFLLYVSDLMNGRIDPETIEGWHARPRQPDLARLLNEALGGRGVAAVLESLAPPHEGYGKLRSMLEDYRRISALGGWPRIPAGPVLRQGSRGGRLPLLRSLLRLTGDLAEEEGAEGAKDVFDASVRKALIRFQARHGLTPDGVLGPTTLAALNIPVEERIRQIEINLERWRWMGKNFGHRYLMVNIADFSLQVVDEGRTVMSMPVVVGTAYRKTPVFSASMTYLEFAPYWTVPSTILREDKLPLIKKNPGLLKRRHYEIISWSEERDIIDPDGIDWKKVEARTFPGTLRMKPGPWNPLGRIKFMFPNRFAVYLHDTPQRYLFSRDVRSYSSGCIRVERPLDLAQYLLEGREGWNCDLIQAAMESENPLTVGLPSPWPIHILYWTAWVDEAGELQFRDDFYLRDLDMELALIRAAEGAETPRGKVLTAGF